MDHLPPGTDPDDVAPAPESEAAAQERRPRADEIPPSHEEDTRGSGPVAERPHLHGPDQNPQ